MTVTSEADESVASKEWLAKKQVEIAKLLRELEKPGASAERLAYAKSLYFLGTKIMEQSK